MKLRLFLTSILVVLSVIIANAQPPQGGERQRMDPEQMAKMQTERMTEDLKLNDKQKTEVQAINLKYSKKMGEIFKAGTQGDREAIRTKMLEMNTQKNVELKKVLTEEQYKKFEEQEKKRMQERQERQGQGRPEGNGQRGGQRGGDN